MKRHTIEDKLAFTNWNFDHTYPHLTLNEKVCAYCTHHSCTYCCPANCYEQLEDGRVVLNYDQCVECGTCFSICDLGSVKWNNPKGTFGVIFRQG